MSTKIYGGLRVRTADLPDFVAAFNALSVAFAGDFLKRCAAETKLPAAQVRDMVVATLRAGGDLKERLQKNLTDVDWMRMGMLCMAREASFSPLKDVMCVDASMNIIVQGEYTLVVPYVSRGLEDGLIDKVNEKVGRKVVEEYGYWNNTDKLESVTDEQWAEREAAWEACLTRGGEWAPHRMVHMAVELKNLDAHDDWTLVDAMYAGEGADEGKMRRLHFLAMELRSPWIVGVRDMRNSCSLKDPHDENVREL